jgi:Ribbon-helix-helix protein, copG family
VSVYVAPQCTTHTTIVKRCFTCYRITMDEFSHQTAIRLSPDMKRRLEAEAVRTGRTTSNLIRWVLATYLDGLPNAPGASAKRVSKRPRKQRLEA